MGSPRGSSKFRRIIDDISTPSKTTRSDSKAPKTSQNKTKNSPGKSKTRFFDKHGISWTPIFTMFLVHTASQRRSVFLPKYMKKQISEPKCLLGIQDHIFVSKRSRKWLPRESQNTSRIDKIQLWNPKVPQEVSLWTTGSPKLFPRPQKGASRCSEWHLRGLKSHSNSNS